METKSLSTVFSMPFTELLGRRINAGVFRIIAYPQTSCDYYQAALTFNKRDLLSVLKPYGIKTATSYYLNKGDVINTDEIVAKVGLRLFCKTQ
jgi:D-alanine-D-alanine ligase-like ATP-grasp enzyme